MTRPKVMIVENSMDFTGGLNSIMRSSTALADRMSFHFLIPTGSTIGPYLTERSFTFSQLPMREIRKNTISLFIYLPNLFINVIRFFSLVKKLDISLITSNDFYNMVPPLYKFFGGTVPYVCYVRFLPSRFPKLLVNFWCSMHLKYADSIVAVSEAVRKQLPRSEKVIVIPNELPEIDTEFILPSSQTIFYPANYISGKGQEYAIESFAKISSVFKDWSLRFVGGDMGLQKNREFREELKAKAQKLKIADHVIIDTFKSNLKDEYLNAAIVVNFSDSESFSLTCLEAMFYGRPIIATDSGGPSDIIDDNISGLLVPVRDIEAMTIALTKLMGNADERDRLAKEAYHRVRKKFSYANTIAMLAIVYLNVLSRMNEKQK